MFSKNIFVVGFAFLSLSMTACSGNVSSWVKGVDIVTGSEEGQSYVKVSAKLETGSIILVPVILPVFHPNKPSEMIGSVMISASQVDLTFKTNSFLSLPGQRVRAILPNGLEVPMAGINSQNWIKIPAKNGNTLVYLNYDVTSKKIALGAAINVDDLSIGTPAAILMPFEFSNVTGFAGIYTGQAKETSGFTIFADASKTLLGTSTAKFVETRTSKAGKIEEKVMKLNMKGSKLKAK